MNLKLYTLDSSGAKLRLSLVKACCVTHTHSSSIKVIAGSVKANAVGLNGLQLNEVAYSTTKLN